MALPPAQSKAPKVVLAHLMTDAISEAVREVIREAIREVIREAIREANQGLLWAHRRV